MSPQIMRELSEIYQKLEGMVMQMKDLQAKAETLHMIPWINNRIANIEPDIKRLSESINAVESTIGQLQETLENIPVIDPEDLIALSDQIKKDGAHAHSKIDHLTHFVIDVEGKNNALTTIEDELILEPKDMTWYQKNKVPDFRIWDLGHMRN